MEPLDLPSSQSVDIRTNYYFTLYPRVGGAVVAVFGAISIMDNVFVGLLFFLTGLFVATSQYRITVDSGRNKYFDYSWIFFFKFGKHGNFNKIEYIFINKNKVSQTVRVRVANTSFSRYDYNGYLKFSEHQKIHLYSNSSKKYVVRQMEYVAAKLNCQVKDYTEED
jgi:hypothetical protein